MASKDRSNAKDEVPAQAKETSWLEWVVALVGAIIVVGMAAYLVYFGVTSEGGPPEVTIEQTAITRAGDGYVVQFTAHNGSASTAAGLRVAGLLMDGDKVLEKSLAEIDYLPENSARKGGLIFSHDPGRYKLLLRSEGYTEP